MDNQSPNNAEFRSGFAALIGRPNVGKSTLMNALVGQKVAIMSNRPQTTRNRIRGVMTTETEQIIFVDTPGIHHPKHRLGEYMVEAAEATFKEVDLIVFVADVTETGTQQDEEVLKRLTGVQTPVILVLNKVDAVAKPAVLTKIEAYRNLYAFEEIVPVSAKDGTQVADLRQVITRFMPEGPKYYPDETVTDHPEQFIIAEFIREKVLRLTREEVPHSVMVDIEQLERREESDVLYVHAVIYTERDSQKAILIGKQGSMLKRVGELARKELEGLFGTKVYLELWVKVKKDWRNEPSLLRRFGFQDL
ncbi:GTPase Era [Alicyclobacillus tolerans]|uniref:GTPase Era n=1 Tax=Alicyclobacillus tolerans TaxID=90970 RepID=UPI001F017346|nr:GTPase Era [Alicyclobacillus tolerans]MCF8563341.1 GTPase Era [Alicyclobacillus tolerans]